MQQLSLKLAVDNGAVFGRCGLFFLTYNGNDLQLCHAVVLNCARRFDSFMFSFRSLMCTQKKLVSGIADHMGWRWG